MFRIVEVTRRGAALRIRNACLEVSVEGKATTVSFPLDEISVVLLSQSAVTLTGSVPMELAARKIPMIFCDGRMLPAGVLSPCRYDSDSSYTVLEAQLAAPLPLKKRIWQKLVAAKIAGQDRNLKKWRDTKILEPLCSKVLSGDRDNREGRAAALYWKALALFSRRDPAAADSNVLFNYAYTVLYAVFAREIVAAGLLPKLGVHHHHRNNPYVLASDLMEPLRPCMDDLILQSLEEGMPPYPLLTENKRELLRKIYGCRIAGQQGERPLFSVSRDLVHSFKRALVDRSAASFCCLA